MPVIIPNRFCIIKKNKQNEAFGKGLMFKMTDAWDNEFFEFLGSIKTPSPHTLHLRTTQPLIGRECKVVVF
jgi:hypothetical protein